MNQILKFGRSILALILMVFFMGPIYWLINTSLKSPIELLGDNVQIFPKSFYWGNYSDALEKSGIIRAFLNSIFVSLTSTLLIILLIAAPAYYFARRKNKITHTMSMWILI
ncbi:MAG: hypothetical protein RL147_1203, partial [Actinomycetota bacterium]